MNNSIRLRLVPLQPTNARMETRDDLDVYRVVGDSMTQATGDSFPDGSRILVDDAQEFHALQDGDYIACYFTQGGKTRDVFGRYNRTTRTLEFLNPAYTPIALSDVHFGGRVVESVCTIYRRS